MPLPTSIPQQHVGIHVDPYLLADFTPRPMPLVAALGYTTASISPGSVSDALAAQLAIDMGCTTRWIADPSTFTDHGDGTYRWVPSQGDNMAPYWSFAVATMPTMDLTYGWKLRDGVTEVSYPALSFAGDNWGTLIGFPDHIAGFTCQIVARIRGTNGGAYADIFCSNNYVSDPDASADTALQYRPGWGIRTIKKGYMTWDDIRDTGRPQIVGCRQGMYEAAQIIGDDNWSFKRFLHDQVNAYDMSWFFGRQSDTYNAKYTLRAEVLDICIWDHARTDANLRLDAKRLNGIYSVVR